MSATPALPAPDSFLPLTPAVFHIMVALADGPKHGYAIMREVDETSSGSVRMGPGTLYGSLDRMAEAGLIEECEATEQLVQEASRPRRYYRLTTFGRRVAELEAERLAEAVKLARSKRLFIHA